jgi:hypothetical protein
VLVGSDQHCQPNDDGEPDCMKELQVNLATIIVTRLIVGNFTEVILPSLLAFIKRWLGKVRSHMIARMHMFSCSRLSTVRYQVVYFMRNAAERGGRSAGSSCACG